MAVYRKCESPILQFAALFRKKLRPRTFTCFAFVLSLRDALYHYKVEKSAFLFGKSPKFC